MSAMVDRYETDIGPKVDRKWTNSSAGEEAIVVLVLRIIAVITSRVNVNYQTF
jgi:hypothetical protein